jgi:hypothetical protein
MSERGPMDEANRRWSTWRAADIATKQAAWEEPNQLVSGVPGQRRAGELRDFCSNRVHWACGFDL